MLFAHVSITNIMDEFPCLGHMESSKVSDDFVQGFHVSAD